MALAPFKEYLVEAISPSSLKKVSFLVQKYLKKQTNQVCFQYPGVEQFKNSTGLGFGVRYYFPKKGASVRFNWKTPSNVGLTGLKSITLWTGLDPKPYIINFDSDVSLVKTLPIIAEIIKNQWKPASVYYTMPDDVPLNESFDPGYEMLTEARFDMESVFDGTLDILQQPNFAKGKIYSAFKGSGMKVFNELERRFPSVIVKSGTAYTFSGGAKEIKAIKSQRADILSTIGAVEAKVSRGSAKETYTVDPIVDKMENDMERLTFEQQITDLENLTKLTIAGSSNSLWVAGKGGTGKTHTVEATLAKAGLRDGQGYFKNTGSASAAGIYALLFRHKTDVVLFDDCDSAFSDQEARNIFKAAADTKKVRKLVWNKMGKNVADPDEMTDDEILAQDMIPRYFEFTGKIIAISNLSLNKLDPDGALRTRGFIINIDPTDMEIYDFMEKIADSMPLVDGLSLDSKDRKHVVDLLRKGKSKQAPNLRKLVRGMNLYAGANVAGVSVSADDLQRMIEQYA